MNREPLLLRALRGESIERYPIWVMRQAGRYMEEYREMKARHSFSELCLVPELSVEVALQPIRAFGFDAAILFSDIMIPARTLGFGIDFAPGPVVKNPVKTGTDIQHLPQTPDLSPIKTVFEAIRTLKGELKGEALIGFAATPWTLACYLLDQKPFKHFERSLIWAQTEPLLLKRFLELLTVLTIEYTIEQVKAGAQVIQLFDSWGGILPPEMYQEFSLFYSNRIFQKLNDAGAETILYLNGAAPYEEQLQTLRAGGLSIDSKCSLSRFSATFPKLALQGNLESTILFSNDVESKTKEMLNSVNRKTSYIVNLGHGILQETPRASVRELVETVKSYAIR